MTVIRSVRDVISLVDVLLPTSTLGGGCGGDVLLSDGEFVLPILSRLQKIN